MTPLTYPQAYVEGLSTAGTLSVSAVDIVMYSLIVILIISIIWLSNRHIRISEKRMDASEKLLENERDSLERRISERTVEFVRAEEQRMIELQRNADFGKLSQGLFHDLISPLSSVSLYAQQLDSGHVGDVANTKEMVRTVIESSKRMNSFMESVRRSLGNEVVAQSDGLNLGKPKIAEANVNKEINIVLDILGYKARMAGVRIEVKMRPKDYLLLPIHPVRLHQLLVNLVSNAIDACIAKTSNLEEKMRTGTEGNVNSAETVENLNHVVTISVIKKNSDVELSVSDTGCGISEENQSRLFRDQFTTKKNGSGIGMMTVKTIVKQDLGGTIEVQSEEGKGARFVVKIPLKKG